MRIEGANIIFEKAEMQEMFTEKLTTLFLDSKKILDDKNIPFAGRKLIIPLDGASWYGMRIETKGVPNG